MATNKPKRALSTNLDSSAPVEFLEPLKRLTRDLKHSSITMTPHEARFLVDSYYSIQDYRKATNLQCQSMTKASEPHEVLSWMFAQHETLEAQIKRALDAWSDEQPMGKWARSICGIGPVIASGLMAHIDITKANTASKVWRFGGLDPTVTWSKGERRPWNAQLKTLLWKIGQSFVKVSNRDDDFYGHLWQQRKAYEIRMNVEGKLIDQAATAAARIKRDDTDSKLWNTGCLTAIDFQAYYDAEPGDRITFAKKHAKAPGSGIPMLSPGHIQARSTRWTVKLFSAHWHEVAYRLHYGGQAPRPYVLEHMGHVDKIEPPNLSVVGLAA